jgi:hypothetical protein
MSGSESIDAGATTNLATIDDCLIFSSIVYTPSAVFTSASYEANHNDIQLPSGWKFLTDNVSLGIDKGDTAFYACAFQCSLNGEIVIAYKGSQSARSFLQADAQLALGQYPSQFTAATAFEADIVKADPKSSIFLTGHSLGGAEAEAVAAATKLPGDTFAAPGISNIVGSVAVAGFVNYIIAGDPVGDDLATAGTAGGHIGAVKLLPAVVHVDHLLPLTSGFNLAIDGLIFAFESHLLGTYSQAVHAANLGNDPLSHKSPINGDTQFIDLAFLFPSLNGKVTRSIAGGGYVQSGTITAKTAAGTAHASVSETLNAGFSTAFTSMLTSGAVSSSETVTTNAAGDVVSNSITLAGMDIVVSAGETADIGVDKAGNSIAAFTSPYEGLEVTVSVTPKGIGTVTIGNAALNNLQQIFGFAPDGLSGDTLTVSGENSHHVTLTTVISAGGSATLTTDAISSSVSQSIRFLSSDGNLTLNDPFAFNQTIYGFVAGDTINISDPDNSFNSFGFDDATNSLQIGIGSQTINLQFDPNVSYAGQAFGLGAGPAGYLQLTTLFSPERSHANMSVAHGPRLAEPSVVPQSLDHAWGSHLSL